MYLDLYIGKYVRVTGPEVGVECAIIDVQDITVQPYPVCCQCDLNNDGKCDMIDWVLFGQRWGATNCNTVPCSCDLNGDGRCNMTDWVIFGKNWGKTDCARQ